MDALIPKLRELDGINTPEVLLEALEDLMAQLQIWLASGSSIQLEGLDAHVARLCQGILTLPEQQGRLLAPRLETLASQFGELGATLQAERQHIKDELAQLEQRRKAHQAYGKVSSQTKHSTEGER